MATTDCELRKSLLPASARSSWHERSGAVAGGFSHVRVPWLPETSQSLASLYWRGAGHPSARTLALQSGLFRKSGRRNVCPTIAGGQTQAAETPSGSIGPG